MPDSSLARAWYGLSAGQEYRTAMRAMARTFLYGSRNDRNWALARRWLELATDGGDDEAPYTLALCEMLHADVSVRDADQAHAWLKLASERGNSRATEVLRFESNGMKLDESMRYVLSEPSEERYVHRQAIESSTGPTRTPQAYRVVEPVYPDALRFTDVTGDVLVEFIVDTTGQVRNAKIVRSDHPLFSDRALEAIARWRFHPGRKDGRLVNTRMQVPIHFGFGPEQFAGLDELLGYAASCARRLGPEASADATELRLAKFKTRPQEEPRLADGSPFPPNARGMVLLVLDTQGTPLRGYILRAEPDIIGPALLKAALGQEFIPREVEGKPVPSNVVLLYISGKYLKTNAPTQPANAISLTRVR
jgi:TonB family protein